MGKRKGVMEYAVVINDPHVPYHDEKAIGAAFALTKDLKPVRVYVNGDLCDFYTLSKYEKDPSRKENLAYELNEAKGFLRGLRKAAESAEIVLLEGNHEVRLRAYLSQNAPALSCLPQLTLPELLGLSEYNIRFVPARSRGAFEVYDNVVVGHFDRVSKHSAFTAKALVDDHMCTVIQGHTHRLGWFFKSTLGGEYQGVEGGCLCKLNPNYLDTANWQQGCVVLHREVGEKVWNLDLVPIKDGVLRYNGKIFTGKELS